MKKIIALGVLCFLLASQATLVADAAFSDAGGSQYVDSINALQARGMAQRYADGSFRPFQPINRAEFLKLVMSAKNISTADVPGGCFSDVKSEWFAPYVCKAVQMGFVQGYPDGTFRAGKIINMVEAQKIVSQAFDLSIRPKTAVEEWFAPYMEFYHNNSFFSKYSYLPGRDFRREEMAFLINELLLNSEGKRPLTFARNSNSVGCGKKPPAQVLSKFSVDGVERSAIVYVPTSYNSSKPLSLVFAFHGRTNSNERVRGYFGMDRATAGNAIVVYPAGNKTGSSYNWNGGAEFFDVMLRDIKNAYCINTDQVYAVGHSLGAAFVNDLACVRADLLRGVASLGGSRGKTSCNGPVAVMIWHNPKDNLAPYSGGVAAKDSYIKQNTASTQTEKAEPAWGNCVRYLYSYPTSPVIWCPHTIDNERDGTYYPHVWPRDTGVAMWNFFRTLPI